MVRDEYPRPQFVRADWTNLNGEWDFEVDSACSGQEKEFFKRSSLGQKITVPFCPESELSGIGNRDFMPCVWYRRDIEIPPEADGKRTILHFGAVDYHAIVYVNGVKVTEHKGGYTPFSADITDYLKSDGNYITLCAYDDVRSCNQPSGKQSQQLNSFGCSYTRTTGIWQTVWMEYVNAAHIESIRMTTDIDAPSVTVGVKVSAAALGATVSLNALWDGKSVGSACAKLFSPYTEFTIPLSETHLWDVGCGNLYDLDISLGGGNSVLDNVSSYFGLRSVAMDGKKFRLNGKTVFGRWVLDQGFYPDGIYTAPSDEAMKNDILYSLQLGFNGARMHEKVFEPRYIYWADRLGYLVWGEHANWGLNITEPGQIRHFLPEWLEAMQRDFNHPSIIGWCPFNETWSGTGNLQCGDILSMVYHVTKFADPTRPVIDTSGYVHVITDIYDVHDYEQDTKKFAENYAHIDEGILNDQTQYLPKLQGCQKYYGNLPVFVSEYGGARWAPDDGEGWGYGNSPRSGEEFVARYKGLTDALLDNENIMGFCYTQLYDVEQEKNGLMTYDRKFKFDPGIFRKINERKAAIER